MMGENGSGINSKGLGENRGKETGTKMPQRVMIGTAECGSQK